MRLGPLPTLDTPTFHLCLFTFHSSQMKILITHAKNVLRIVPIMFGVGGLERVGVWWEPSGVGNTTQVILS